MEPIRGTVVCGDVETVVIPIDDNIGEPLPISKVVAGKVYLTDELGDEIVNIPLDKNGKPYTKRHGPTLSFLVDRGSGRGHDADHIVEGMENYDGFYWIGGKVYEIGECSKETVINVSSVRVKFSMEEYVKVPQESRGPYGPGRIIINPDDNSLNTNSSGTIFLVESTDYHPINVAPGMRHFELRNIKFVKLLRGKLEI